LLADEGISDVTRHEETSKPAPATPMSDGHEPTAPFWARIPRGWIILVLFVLAWVAVYLIWNGIRLLGGA
jgi:hypothetical protein